MQAPIIIEPIRSRTLSNHLLLLLIPPSKQKPGQYHKNGGHHLKASGHRVTHDVSWRLRGGIQLAGDESAAVANTGKDGKTDGALVVWDKTGSHPCHHKAGEGVDAEDEDEHGGVASGFAGRAHADDVGGDNGAGREEEEESTAAETVGPVCLGEEGAGTDGVDRNGEVVGLERIVPEAADQSREEHAIAEDGDARGEEGDGGDVDERIREGETNPLPLKLVFALVDGVALLTKAHDGLVILTQEPGCLGLVGDDTNASEADEERDGALDDEEPAPGFKTEAITHALDRKGEKSSKGARDGIGKVDQGHSLGSRLAGVHHGEEEGKGRRDTGLEETE